MGLYVKVYGNIKLAENEEDANFKAFVIDEDWNYKIKNLQDGKNYTGEVLYCGVSYSCSMHNRFRERLVKLVGREDLLDGEGKIKWAELPIDIPFYDFIDFADNEGCLDWEVSNTIYSDFVKYNEKAKLEMDYHFYTLYETWLETFMSAKDGNVVVFS